MSYVLSEIVTDSCQKIGPFATSIEASATPCPTGTSFRSYTADGGKTLKICCPQPARLAPVASVNAPNAPVTPLDCPRGTHFVQSGNTFQCAYCFPVTGGEACPGIPGIGRYVPQVKPQVSALPIQPVLVTLPPVTPLIAVTPPVVLPETKTTDANASWVSTNWKWLVALATAGGLTYWWAQRKV